MIIVKLTGGLGNQMFQYAFGKFLSLKNNSPLWLYTGYYQSKADRLFLLNQLNCKYHFKIPHRILLKVFEKFLKPKQIKDKYYLEIENLDQKGNIILDGYWENPNYFREIISTIQKEFTLKKQTKEFEKELSTIRADSISIHVRRGDYLVPHGKYLNSIQYYNQAVEEIIRKTGLKKPQIVIFSDDKEWCKKELRTLANINTTTFENTKINDVEEMQLMSRFTHNVISNSTFSWWSAVLNKNPKKIVVMPKNWYTDEEFNKRYLKEIFVPGWIII